MTKEHNMKELKIKTTFETSDGKIFTNKALAENHQKESIEVYSKKLENLKKI